MWNLHFGDLLVQWAKYVQLSALRSKTITSKIDRSCERVIAVLLNWDHDFRRKDKQTWQIGDGLLPNGKSSSEQRKRYACWHIQDDLKLKEVTWLRQLLIVQQRQIDGALCLGWKLGGKDQGLAQSDR